MQGPYFFVSPNDLSLPPRPRPPSDVRDVTPALPVTCRPSGGVSRTALQEALVAGVWFRGGADGGVRPTQPRSAAGGGSGARLWTGPVRCRSRTWRQGRGGMRADVSGTRVWASTALCLGRPGLAPASARTWPLPAREPLPRRQRPARSVPRTASDLVVASPLHPVAEWPPLHRGLSCFV